MAAALKATIARTHHSGGRHAARPIQMPAEKAIAAQNRGWRAGTSSGSGRLLRGLGRVMLCSSARPGAWDARAGDGEAAKRQRQRGQSQRVR